METDFNYTSGDGYFTSDEKKWIRKIYEFKEQYPDLVQLLAEPKDNDGTIYCKLPASWLHVKPPRKCNLTEEQKNQKRETVEKARAAKLAKRHV